MYHKVKKIVPEAEHEQERTSQDQSENSECDKRNEQNGIHLSVRELSRSRIICYIYGIIAVYGLADVVEELPHTLALFLILVEKLGGISVTDCIWSVVAKYMHGRIEALLPRKAVGMVGADKDRLHIEVVPCDPVHKLRGAVIFLFDFVKQCYGFHSVKNVVLYALSVTVGMTKIVFHKTMKIQVYLMKKDEILMLEQQTPIFPVVALSVLAPLMEFP